MVEAGGVGVFSALKTRKLLKNLSAQKSRNAQIAPNWNVPGTREVRALIHKQLASLYENILCVACYEI
jgi:hypothetical protein